MHNHIRRKGPRRAASALVAAGAVAIAAGIAAAPSQAAPKDPTLQNGVLTVPGTSAADKIALRLQAGQPGTLQVDFGDDGTADFSFARADVSQIVVNAGNGDDLVRIDDSGGPFTDTIPTTLDGGAGDDTLLGGSGGETLLGGNGNDSIDGNRGSDVALMGGGADTFTWDPGDGSDVVEGQNGNDTMQFNGANINEQIDLSANGSRLRLFRNVANITMDTDGVEQVNVRALGGSDQIIVDDLSATAVKNVNLDLGTDGQADQVIANGTNADDLIKVTGSDGAATVSGLAATINLAGAEPANDSLTINGLGGDDVAQLSGSTADDQLDLSPNGSAFTFARNGSIAVGTTRTEEIDVAALAGADRLNVGDLTGTGVSNLNLDLGNGDGQADQVSVNGTGGADNIAVAGRNGTATITGLPATVSITKAEPANDSLTVNGLAGADTIDASGLAAKAIKLTLNGGDDADTLVGSAGSDLVNGGRANDVALLGAGDDTFVWNPGDASDIVEGQDGNDTMQFNGANVNEHIDLSANGSRLRFTRDVANITMDTNGVEQVNFKALGGTDSIIVNDLSGTAVKNVNLDLGNDGQADQVIVNATDGDDVVHVSGGNGAASVSGLAAAVNITGAEPANDALVIGARGGDDAVEASGLAASSVVLTIDGGTGDDVLVGSAGNDTIFGREGDDVLIGGPGQDLLDGGPGNNILIQD